MSGPNRWTILGAGVVREDRVTDADVEAIERALPDLLRYVDGQLVDPHGSACRLAALVLGVSSDGEDGNG